MAQYHHLSVYKKAFDLFVKISQVTTNFPRDFRYTVGEKLNNGCVEFIVHIYKANTARTAQRLEHIVDLLDKLQVINVLIRLACELKHISKERYIELITMAEDIEKQLGGWQNYTETEAKNELSKKKLVATAV